MYHDTRKRMFILLILNQYATLPNLYMSGYITTKHVEDTEIFLKSLTWDTPTR